MSGALEAMQVSFDKRMKARRAMMDNLGLCPTEDEAPALFGELRATLLACAECHNIDRCRMWLDHGVRGVPPFCSGSGAFTALEDRMKTLDTVCG